MSRVAFILSDPRSRDEAEKLCRTAQAGTYAEFMSPDDKRTDAQNRKMWPMLGEIAKQVEWPKGSGMRLSSEDWKLMFLDALGYEMRMVPGIHMRGYVNLGRSSSRLKKREFIDLIEIIYAFGAEHGVRFKEPKERALMTARELADA
jgi:hypothetical protein